MRLKNNRTLIITVHILIYQINHSCVCLNANSQPSHPVTEMSENIALVEEKLLSVRKNEFLDTSGNNPGTLVSNTTVSSNVGSTKENCRTVLCFRKIILHRKEKNTLATLNRIFYKLCRRCKKEYDKLAKDGVQKKDGNSKYASRKLVKRSTEVNGTMERPDDHTQPSNESEIKEKITASGNMSLEGTRSSILEFPDAPPGNLIKVLDLKLEEGYFRVFSHLIGYLQPTSFPLDFLRNVMENEIPIHLLIFKAIKIEGQVLCWLFIWLILSLALPCAIIAQSCCSKKGLQRLHDNYSIASDRYTERWIRNITASLMHLFLFLLLGGVMLMLTTNEQISQTATSAPNRIKIMFEDIETFVDNTQLQISSVTTSSMQIAMEAAHKDLEDGEELLGKPLRQALHAETGLETAIQALADLTVVAAELSSRVSALINDCNKARSAGKTLQGSLIELSKLLTLTRQECLPRDRPFCDTLQTQPFTVTLYVDQLTSDYHLQRLQRIGSNENFNRTIEIAQRTFQGLPKRVSLETAASRTEIRSILNKYRNNLFDSVQLFEDVMNSFKGSLVMYKNEASPIAENVAKNDLWRWISVLGLSLLTFLVWGLLICGAPCGCDSTPKTIPFLQTGLGLTCVLSLIMWTFGAVSFLIGGHCHTLICQPLYEDPTYITLNDLLNTRDVISRNHENLLYRILKANNSLRVDGIFTNCRNNQSAFQTFGLQSIFNIDTLTNAKEWHEYSQAVKRFPAILNNFEVLSPRLQENLKEFSSLSQVNFTAYRVNISQTVTNKDLSSLADQLKSVAKHLTDARTAENMERLAFRTQILTQTEFQRLKKIRDDILYQMAALEVFLVPINKQINQSLSHLRPIQYFIDNDGNRISRKITNDYIDGVNGNLEQMYNFVKKKVIYEIGNCQPLWETFDMTRISVCNMMVDPLNGFSFACFFCILLFLALAPVTIRAIEQFRKDFEGSLDSITHRRARNGMLINEEGTWATPSPRSSSEEYHRHDLLASETPWVISRENMDSTIPSPPRFPERAAIPQQSSRIAEAFAKSTRVLDAAKLIRGQPRISEPTPDVPPSAMARSQGLQSMTSVARILDSARSIQSHLRAPEPQPAATPSASSIMSSSQSLIKAARMLDAAKTIQSTSRHPETTRNIKSPIPRIIQAMTSKARNRYESLKLIERLDRISPKSWL